MDQRRRPGLGRARLARRKVFEETGDEAKAQGWTPIVLDTNGNGKRDEWTEPNQPLDPAKDRRVVGALYGIGVNPKDGSIWGTVLTYPGYVIRVEPGANPSETALAEDLRAADAGLWPARLRHRPRRHRLGAACERPHGQVRPQQVQGAAAGPRPRPAGTARRAGRSIRSPARSLPASKSTGSAEASYYTWVDQFDTFGLGRNVPWATGNANESLMALVDGQWLNFVVPYPLGFYAKWMDGRIDDPNAGWKGRGVWATYGTRTPFHLETGKGTRPKVVKFQLRPDPLAR